MKIKFENLQINDGKMRITVPKKVKKSGGNFTWGKSMIFFVILALLLFYGILIYRDENGDKITETQWISMLSDSFGVNTVSDLEAGSEEIATGKFAAVTVMRVVGRGNLTYLSGKEVLSESDLITMAADYNVVSGTLMNKKLTEKDALEIIEQAEQFYYNPYNFPEYCEVVYKDDVVINSKIDVLSFDQENNTAIVAFDAEEIEDGTIMILELEPGILKSYSVSSAIKQGEGVFAVTLGYVNELSDVIDSIDFSGTVDFRSVFFEGSSVDIEAGEGGGEEAKAIDGYDVCYSSISKCYAQSPMLLVASANPIGFETTFLSQYSENPFTKEYWSDEAKEERKAEKAAKKEVKEDKKAINEEFLATVDLEMGGKIEDIAKNDLKTSFKYSQYIEYSTEDENGKKSTAKYEMSVNEKGQVKISPAKNDFRLDVEIDNALKVKKEDDDNIIFKPHVDPSLSYKVKISDLSVCGSTYFQRTDWDDVKNYVDFRVSGDIDIEAKLQGKLEGKFLIYDKEFPIPVTYGIAAVGLRFYLVVTAAGEIYMTYEIDNVHSSVYASQKGVNIGGGVGGTDFDINTKVKLEVGPDIEVALSVLGFDVLDPSIKARAVASAETLPKNEGFEEYEKCVQLHIAGPTLKVVFMGDDNVLNKILNQFGLSLRPSYEFLDENNAPLKKDLHIETELDWTQNVFEGKADEVCTHLKVVEEEDKPFKLQDEVEKRKEEMEQKISDKVQNVLAEWFIKSCDGCFY